VKPSIGQTRRSETGMMRHRLTVQSAEPSLDPSRQKVITYTTKWNSEPAAFIQVSGGETIRGQQVEAGVTAMFKVNYRSGYTETDRIVFDGENYGIVRIEVPDGVKRFQWLHCKSVK
jgi:SPP1 family predicted phage head-tail adaptor